MENFQKGSYKIMMCDFVLDDVGTLEEHKEILVNHHEGTTNHRGLDTRDIPKTETTLLLAKYVSRYTKVA